MPKPRPNLQPRSSKGFVDGLTTSGKVRPPGTTPSTIPRLTIVLVVAVLAAGLWAAWRFLPGLLMKTYNNHQVATQVINVDLNANTTPAIIDAPTEVKGKDAFSGTVTVSGVKLTFSSLQRQTTWQDSKAGAGQTFLVLYFEPVAPADVDKVNQGLINDAHVVRGLTTYPLQSVQIATTTVRGNRGYLKFEVPDQGIFKLEIGTGTKAQHLSIP